MFRFVLLHPQHFVGAVDSQSCRKIKALCKIRQVVLINVTNLTLTKTDVSFISTRTFHNFHRVFFSFLFSFIFVFFNTSLYFLTFMDVLHHTNKSILL